MVKQKFAFHGTVHTAERLVFSKYVCKSLPLYSFLARFLHSQDCSCNVAVAMLQHLWAVQCCTETTVARSNERVFPRIKIGIKWREKKPCTFVYILCTLYTASECTVRN